MFQSAIPNPEGSTMEIGIYGHFDGIVKQYPYRTALIGDIFMSAPIQTAREFERQLAAAADVQPDNHTIYEITREGGAVYVQFSDMLVTFGLSIREERW